MALLTQQSFASIDKPYFLVADTPITTKSPFVIKDGVNTLTLTPSAITSTLPIVVNTGLPSFSFGTINTSSNELRVAVQGASSNLILSNTSNTGTIRSGTSILSLENTGIVAINTNLRVGNVSFTYSNEGFANTNTANIQAFRNGETIVGGFGIQSGINSLFIGTSNFTSNFTTINNFAIEITSNNETQINGAFAVRDPTLPNFFRISNTSNFVNLSSTIAGTTFPVALFGSNFTTFASPTNVPLLNISNGVFEFLSNKVRIRNTGNVGLSIDSNGLTSFPNGITLGSISNASNSSNSIGGVTLSNGSVSSPLDSTSSLGGMMLTNNGITSLISSMVSPGTGVYPFYLVSGTQEYGIYAITCYNKDPGASYFSSRIFSIVRNDSNYRFQPIAGNDPGINITIGTCDAGGTNFSSGAVDRLITNSSFFCVYQFNPGTPNLEFRITKLG